MNLDPVDGREVVKCDKCKLVQFKSLNEVCKRCKTSYAPVALPVDGTTPDVQDGSADPTSSLGEGFAAQSAFPHLPATIRRFRKDLGLSQRQLAAKMQVPRTYVSKIERENCTPTLSSMERLAVALHCSVVDLVEGAQQTERDPFILEVFEGTRKLPQRQKEYIVDMVRRLATTKRATA